MAVAQIFFFWLAVIASGFWVCVNVASCSCSLNRGSVRRCSPARVLGSQECKSRKFQQVGEQNCQPEGESLPDAGELQATKTSGQKETSSSQLLSQRDTYPLALHALHQGMKVGIDPNHTLHFTMLWRLFKKHFHMHHAY